ncbi:MAG: T9SS type A sorting domain-containing protein, partial [Saprospiraceae bacterium]
GPFEGDANPANNADRLHLVVRSSFDPNDKSAHTGDLFTTDQYAAGEPLKYTVRFQNTGTYPAQFVRIVDTLDAKFDLTSFSLLASSHPVQVSIEGENRLVFLFDMIHLPDSSADEAGSHGFVTYSLKPRPGLPVGAIFRNTAHIFFDYNLPVRTNTVMTILSLPVGVHEAIGRPVSLWPNPTSGELHLRLPGGGSVDALQIFDLWGRLVKTAYPAAGEEPPSCSIAELPPGVYFVKCRQNGGTTGVAKVVKQ